MELEIDIEVFDSKIMSMLVMDYIVFGTIPVVINELGSHSRFFEEVLKKQTQLLAEAYDTELVVFNDVKYIDYVSTFILHGPDLEELNQRALREISNLISMVSDNLYIRVLPEFSRKADAWEVYFRMGTSSLDVTHEKCNGI